MALHRVSDLTFADDVLSSLLPVLVTFIGDDVGPSRAILPALELLADQTESQLKVATLEIAYSPIVRARYSIHGRPTLILFASGEPLGRRVGAVMEAAVLKAWCERVLQSSPRSQ